MKTFNELLAQIEADSFTSSCLSLDNAQIDDDMAVSLANALKSNSHIEEVSLGNNRIGKNGAIALANIFESSSVTRLGTLRLGCNKITDEGLQALLKSYLTILDVSDNGLTDNGLLGIEENEFLFELDLSANKITSLGVGKIAKNKTLVILNLSENDVGEGAVCLSENDSIEKLELNASNINSKGVAAFRNNQKLTTLSLSKNTINAESIIELSQNEFITDLNLSHNELTDSDIKPLVQMKSLTSLNLSNNKIKDLNILDLFARFLPGNLDLTENPIMTEPKSLMQLFDRTKALMHESSLPQNDADSLTEIDVFPVAFKLADKEIQLDIISKMTKIPEFSPFIDEAKRMRIKEIQKPEESKRRRC